jgi:hypothetical protein
MHCYLFPESRYGDFEHRLDKERHLLPGRRRTQRRSFWIMPVLGTSLMGPRRYRGVPWKGSGS